MGMRTEGLLRRRPSWALPSQDVATAEEEDDDDIEGNPPGRESPYEILMRQPRDAERSRGRRCAQAEAQGIGVPA